MLFLSNPLQFVHQFKLKAKWSDLCPCTNGAFSVSPLLFSFLPASHKSILSVRKQIMMLFLLSYTTLQNEKKEIACFQE